MAQPSPFVWHEVNTNETPATAAFYHQLFGWEVKEVPIPGVPSIKYSMLVKGEQPIAGIVPMIDDAWKGLRSHWAVYLAVDNVDQMVARAVSLGAKILVPAFDIDSVCRICLIQDPQGAAFYLYQSYAPVNPS